MLWRGRAGFWRLLRDRLPEGGAFSLGQISARRRAAAQFLKFECFWALYCATFLLVFLAVLEQVLRMFFS
jgi:hypothetical protein